MHIKHGQWEGKTIQVEKGKRKKKIFSFKIEISYPDKLSCIILHMKKEMKMAKIVLYLMLRVLIIF